MRLRRQRQGRVKADEALLEAGADKGQRYRRYVEEQLGSAGADEAMHKAIGGEFDAIGAIQCDLLIAQGLRPDGNVIDIGCGSGRLALPLSKYLTDEAHYLGTDVVPDLLTYARALVQRPSWRFEPAKGFTIPAEDNTADIVCFFSVITHLRHEHSYLYLREAKRVLKPTGRIVVSFLEFAIPSHWAVFRHNFRHPHADKPLDQFVSRDALSAWAGHLGLDIIEILDGDKQNIPLRAPVTMEHGATYEDLGAMGQSVVVFGHGQE